MPISDLYVIVNRTSQDIASLLRLCEQALCGGADVIQFRDKGAVSSTTVRVAERLLTLCRKFRVPFVMNDHAEFAKQVGADGLHIGQNDIAVADARRIVGDAVFIGVTVSNTQEALQAEKAGADYLGCGHVYPTITKEKRTPPIGLSGLQQVAESTCIPVVAIGGITAQRVPSVLQTGAAAVVVISAIENNPNPTHACREIKAMITTHRSFSCYPKR